MKKLVQYILLLVLSSVMTILPVSTIAWADVVIEDERVDIYLVYTSRDRSLKNLLLAALRDEYEVKAYNIDLLALADYSGEQKAISKISDSRLIVVINDRPFEVIDEYSLDDVIQVTSFDEETLAMIVQALRQSEEFRR